MIVKYFKERRNADPGRFGSTELFMLAIIALFTGALFVGFLRVALMIIMMIGGSLTTMDPLEDRWSRIIAGLMVPLCLLGIFYWTVAAILLGMGILAMVIILIIGFVRKDET